MFIKLKGAFLNTEGIFAITEPDSQFPNGVIQPLRGDSIELEPGEYEALRAALLVDGAIDLSVVAKSLEDYKAAALRVPVEHVIRTRANVSNFDKHFLRKNETTQPPPPSQPVNAETPREQGRVNPLPPSITNRPGVFPDPDEEL